MILQEYIPGDDNCMRVLNAYCGLDHKVKLMALGRPLLEEQTPEGIGNYAAILSDPEYNDAALLEKLKNFLEDMQWEGFANMDIKYDARTGEYKMFEMNPVRAVPATLSPRQGITCPSGWWRMCWSTRNLA